jgi:hypothetical protein
MSVGLKGLLMAAANSSLAAQLKSPADIGSIHTRVGGQAGTATLIDSGAGTTTGVSLLNPPTPVGTYSVSQLDDIGGNGFHVGVPGATSTRPTLDFTAKVNGYVPVKWDGTDDLMQTITAFTAIAQPFTIWACCKVRSLLNNVYICSGSDSTHQANLLTISVTKWNMGSTATSFSGATMDTSGIDIGGVFNGASSTLYVRGTATNGTGPTQTPQKWTLGARYDSTGFCPLTLYEFVVFTRVLTALEILQLRAYAKLAYLIT